MFFFFFFFCFFCRRSFSISFLRIRPIILFWHSLGYSWYIMQNILNNFLCYAFSFALMSAILANIIAMMRWCNFLRGRRGLSCEPNNQLNVCTTSVTEGEVGTVKNVLSPPVIHFKAQVLMWSLFPVFGVQSFGDVSPYVCSLYFLFGLGCWVATFLGIAAHSVSHLFLMYFVCCDFGYFPYWFWGRDLPSDCSSSCSLLFSLFLHWQELRRGARSKYTSIIINVKKDKHDDFCMVI